MPAYTTPGGETAKEISGRLQRNHLGRCTECGFESEARRFETGSWGGLMIGSYTCPHCGDKNIVFA